MSSSNQRWRRWAEKHPEQVKQKSRKSAQGARQRRKTDPVKRAAYNKYMQEYYQRRKQSKND